MLKLDFSSIAYNIEGIPEDKDVIEVFPDLMARAEIFEDDDVPEGVSKDKTLRYLIYMHSPFSPVVSTFPDINQRRKWTVNKLGIEEKNGETPYKGLILMEEPWAISRFIAFTELQCSEDYAIIETCRYRMAALQREMLTKGIEKSNDDSNYQKALEGYRQMIVDARKRIMNAEDSVKLEKSITFSLTQKMLDIQPEVYTRIWRDKKEIFPEIIP